MGVFTKAARAVLRGRLELPARIRPGGVYGTQVVRGQESARLPRPGQYEAFQAHAPFLVVWVWSIRAEGLVQQARLSGKVPGIGLDDQTPAAVAAERAKITVSFKIASNFASVFMFVATFALPWIIVPGPTS